MATITITLAHPVKLGEQLHHEVTLRELTPEDIIEASLESEKAVLTDAGYQFLSSPSLMGINTLLRQIDSIGDFKGPFTRKMIGKLHREDFELLQMQAEMLDNAVMEAVEKRGRDDASGNNAGADNIPVLQDNSDAA